MHFSKLGARRRRKATAGNPQQRVATTAVGDGTIPTATPGSGNTTKKPAPVHAVAGAPSGRSFMEINHGRVHAFGEADSGTGDQACKSRRHSVAAVVGPHLSMAGRGICPGPFIVLHVRPMHNWSSETDA